jgi:CheY-like chemotaxis protein
LKILLADDSLTAQNMGKKILTEAGHEVFTASNGSVAIKQVSEHRPDLAILDVYMPGYSGLEVCEKIRAATDVAHIPVILTVGKLEPFKKEDAQRVGADALIIKPFEATELVAAVNRIAESLGGPAAVPKTPPVSEKTKIKAGRIKLDMGPAVDAALPASGAKDSTAKDSMAKGSENKEDSPTKNFPANGFPDIPEMPVIAPPQPAISDRADYASRSAWNQAEADDLPADDLLAMKAAAAAASSFDSAFDVQSRAASSPDIAAPSGIAPATNQPEVTAFATAVEQAGAYSGAAASVPKNETSSGFDVDPAFSPDRTTWASEFATHFGVRETENPADDTPSELNVPDNDASVSDLDAADVSQSSAELSDSGALPASGALPENTANDPYAAFESESALTQSASALIEASEDLSERLAALPRTIEEPETSDEPESVGTSQLAEEEESAADYAAGWDSPIASSSVPPVDSTARWVTEELPVAEHESTWSLAEEMEKASAGEVSEATAEVSESVSLKVSEKTSEAVSNQASEEVSEKTSRSELSSGELSKDDSVPRPWPHSELYESSDAALQSADSNSTLDWANASTAPDTDSPSSLDSAVQDQINDQVQDQVTDLVQDKAMESVARQAISLINAEVQAASTDPAHTSPMGTSAIEDMVSRVLQQLKPKLVAEITRELTIDSNKDPHDS